MTTGFHLNGIPGLTVFSDFGDSLFILQGFSREFSAIDKTGNKAKNSSCKNEMFFHRSSCYQFFQHIRAACAWTAAVLLILKVHAIIMKIKQ